MTYDLVVRGARVMTCAGAELAIIDDGAVAMRGEIIDWVGPGAELTAGAARVVDVGGALVTPGLIDCHAHPIFAGDRAGEFAMRAAGAAYQDIAAAGGGIGATLGPTRAATFDALVELTRDRAERALAGGTTTLEAKSGYDLTFGGELRLLRVARAVDRDCAVDLVPTLLGAHLVPPEFRDRRADYVALVCEMVDTAADDELAHAVDVYCDEGAFDADETRTILGRARERGLVVRAHVGQFADLGGAEVVAELGGRSCDHLEEVSPAGIAAMARAGVVAVMLPGACVQLRMTPPPVAALRAAGVAMAVASDLNPGTSYTESLAIQLWLATTHYGMTVDEAWLGVTAIAARAMGLDDRGTLEPGQLADLVIWDAEQPAEIPYHYGANLVRRVIKRGRLLPAQ